MQIAGLGSIQPYYYNMNVLNTNSLNKISGISDNLNSRKTDFTGLTSDSEELINQNPLRPGQSSNFMDILNSQLMMSRTNQSRIMVQPDTVQPEAVSPEPEQTVPNVASNEQQSDTIMNRRVPNEMMLQMLYGL